MKLYFTGADGFGDEQSSSLLSLGGYPSASQVPAAGIDKIFGGISQRDLRNGSVITKAVVLKNTTATDPVTGAKIYYNNNSDFPVANYRFAIVTLALDDCGKAIMEEIANPFDKPNSAVFVDAKGLSNALTFPDIPADSYVGIWIERSINVLKGKESLSCDFLLAGYDVVPEANQSTIQFLDPALLAGEYFTIDTRVNKYVIWFNDGVAAMPAITSSYELLIIAYAVGSETADTLAAKVNTKLQEIPVPRGEMISTVATDTVTVTI